MKSILRWLISAAGVWLAVRYVPGITLEEGYVPLLLVALILGAVNAVVRPILSFLSCAVIFFTFGLFLLVINALMLLLTAWIAGAVGVAFEVDGFVPALLGSIVISVVSLIASTLLFSEEEKRG